MAPRSVHPCHLLLLYEPSADYLVDGGFHERRADDFSLPSTLTEVRNELSVFADVRLELSNSLGNFLRSCRMRLDETQVHGQVDQVGRALPPYRHARAGASRSSAASK